MVLVKVFANGEDLTNGLGVLIKFDSIKTIELMGFRVKLVG